MSAFKGHGTYGNAVGVETPLDFKLNNAAQVVKTTTPLVIRPGVFYAGNASLVSGTAGMAYSVAAYECVTQRSGAAGAVFGGNDGTLSVATTAAPGSNSRIDIIYHWHREYSLDGVDSNPVIGVVQGTAAASPTAPSLAAFPGAIEIGRATVGAGITATTSATITQTAPFTSVDGAQLVFRTTTERDTFTTALLDQRALCLSDQVIYRWNGSAWKSWESDWISYTPTLTGTVVGTGGVATNAAFYKYVAGDVEMKGTIFYGTSGQTFPLQPTISLPVTAETPAFSGVLYAGEVTIFDTSAPATFKGWVRSSGVSATAAQFLAQNSTNGGLASITTAVPMSWAAGDGIDYRFKYRAA